MTPILDSEAGQTRATRASRNTSVSPIATVRVGRHLRVARLGRGGMADTFLALQSAPDGFRKPVVHKVRRSDVASGPEFAQMFADEARLGALVTHPGCVATLDYLVEGDEQTIVLEHVAGLSLNRLLTLQRASKRPIPLVVLGSIFEQLLEAVGYLHQLSDLEGRPLSVVHRDISPSNVMVGWDGRVVLIDLGVAKSITNRYQTQVGSMRGKASYAAPECLLGHRADARSDLYSVAVTMWELFTLRPAFRGEDALATARRVLSSAAPPPSTYWKTVPPSIDAIFSQALGPREGRPSDAGRMLTQLRAALPGPRGTRDEVARWLAETHPEVKRDEDRALHAVLCGNLATITQAAPESLEPVSSPARARSPRAVTTTLPLQVVALLVAVVVVSQLAAVVGAAAVALHAGRARAPREALADLPSSSQPVSLAEPTLGLPTLGLPTLGLPTLAEPTLGPPMLPEPTLAQPTLGQTSSHPAATALARGCEQASTSTEVAAIANVAAPRRAREPTQPRRAAARGRARDNAEAGTATLASARRAFMEGDFESSERLYARVAARTPSARAAMGLGNARARQGDFRGAARAFQEAVRLEPSNPSAQDLLARALARAR
jgi:serine/threonine protein kinase